MLLKGGGIELFMEASRFRVDHLSRPNAADGLHQIWQNGLKVNEPIAPDIGDYEA
jgi:hypothetical protein